MFWANMELGRFYILGNYITLFSLYCALESFEMIPEESFSPQPQAHTSSFTLSSSEPWILNDLINGDHHSCQWD